MRRGTRVASRYVPHPRALLAALLLSLLPRLGHALPNLTPEIYDVSLESGVSVASGDVAEGCAGTTDGRTLVRFGVRSYNLGPDTLVAGDPGCPDCATNPGAICANPQFECSPAQGHNHPHFLDFARYELLDLDGNQVAAGGKRSFCMLDSACPGGGEPVFTDCTYQGISAGCYDDYHPDLGCQYIDVTDVPEVTVRSFRLRVTVDPDALLPDADRTNNVTEVVLPGCGDAVVQANEDCDPGAAGAPCCDASCRFAPAGQRCGTASNPCDGAPVCDGESADCPPAVPLSDGSPCGPGTPPCARAVCRTGQCVVEEGDGCLIDGTCYSAGAPDPQDHCQECDPGRRVGGWSPLVDSTPAGLGCQVERVAAAMGGLTCPARLMRALSIRVGRLEKPAARLPTASSPQAVRLEARLARRAAGLERALAAAARHGTCATTAVSLEVGKLRDQLLALRGARAP
jgi:hypothetical protein